MVCCMTVGFCFGMISCSHDDNTAENGVLDGTWHDESKENGLLNGTWYVTADDWKGIVTFNKELYQIEEYHDDRGYGLFNYKGNFSGTIKYSANQISLFSSDTNGALGEDGYVSHIAGIVWNKPTTVTSEMTIMGSNGKAYQLKKSTEARARESDVYGIWKLSSVDGKVYKFVNGQKGEYIEDVRMGGFSDAPSEIGFSQTTLKNTDGKNVYCVGSYDNDIYFANMSLQGHRMQITGSDYFWFNKFILNIVYVNENELTVSSEGTDGGPNPQYLEFNFVFRRVKTL